MTKGIIKSIVLLTYILVSFTNVSFVYAINGLDLFWPENSWMSEDDASKQKLDYVHNLPDKSYAEILTSVIQKILAVGAALATIAVIVAAIFYMVSMGNEDQMNKAKNILIYTLIGLAIISGAYGLVIGVAKIEIF